MLYDAGAVTRCLCIGVVRQDRQKLRPLCAAVGSRVLSRMIGRRRDEICSKAALRSRIYGRAVGLDRHTSSVRLVIVIAVDVVAARRRYVCDEYVEADRRGVVLDRLAHHLVLHPAAELRRRRARERAVYNAVSRMYRCRSVCHFVLPFNLFAYKKAPPKQCFECKCIQTFGLYRQIFQDQSDPYSISLRSITHFFISLNSLVTPPIWVVKSIKSLIHATPSFISAL